MGGMCTDASGFAIAGVFGGHLKTLSILFVDRFPLRLCDSITNLICFHVNEKKSLSLYLGVSV